MTSSSPTPSATSTSSRSCRRPTATARTCSARRVGFNRKTKVFLHLHMDDMTAEEYIATYTTEEDSHSSQKQLVQSLQIIRRREQQGLLQYNNNADDAADDDDDNDNDNDNDDACIRGLEHMRSAAAMQERKAVKEAVLTAVLDEQDRQWDEDAADDEAIRAVSLRHSTRSQRVAAERARQDALTVRAMVALINHDHRQGGATSSPFLPLRYISPMDVDEIIVSPNPTPRHQAHPYSSNALLSPSRPSTRPNPVTPDNNGNNRRRTLD